MFRNIPTKTYLGVYGSGIDTIIGAHNKGISINKSIIDPNQLWWKVTKNPFLTQAWNKFDKDNITAELKCTNNNM